MGYNADEADVEQQAAEKAYAEKMAQVQADVDKALVERAEAQKSEIQKLVELDRQITRARKLKKLNREVRVTSKERKWRSFIKKFQSKSCR